MSSIFESPATRQVLTKVKSGVTFDEYLRMDHFHLNCGGHLHHQTSFQTEHTHVDIQTPR